MTWEEAIEIFEKKEWWIAQKETLTSKQAEEIVKLNDAVDFVISALRPVSREQVEKVWRGEWIAYLDGEHIMPERYYSCSKCGGRGHLRKKNFCDFCGAPMTDAAVEMVMERLEALHDNRT